MLDLHELYYVCPVIGCSVKLLCHVTLVAHLKEHGPDFGRVELDRACLLFLDDTDCDEFICSRIGSRASTRCRSVTPSVISLDDINHFSSSPSPSSHSRMSPYVEIMSQVLSAESLTDWMFVDEELTMRSDDQLNACGLYYCPQLRSVLCSLCRVFVPPPTTSIITHVRRKHKLVVGRASARLLSAAESALSSYRLNSQSDVRRPRNGCKPVPFLLPPVAGYSCEHCPYACLASPYAMRRHYREQHADVRSEWETSRQEVSVQFLFSGKGFSHVFVVDPHVALPHDSGSRMSTCPSKLMMSIRERSKRVDVEYVASTDDRAVSAFIAHTRWDVKTEGAPIDKLAAVSQHPRGDPTYDLVSSACRLYLDELIKVVLPACGDHVLRDVMQVDTYV